MATHRKIANHMIKDFHSKDAERAILSSLMNYGDLDEVSLLTPDHFYFPKNNIVFAAIKLEASSGSTAFDPIALSHAMHATFDKKGKNNLDAIGGTEYLLELFNATCARSNLKKHAEIVREHAIRRRVAQIGKEFAAEITLTTPIAELVDKAQSELLALSMPVERRNVQYAAELAKEHLTVMEGRVSGATQGLQTGLTDLDSALNGGLMGGDMIIIGARPGMGKTAFALGVGLHISSIPDEDGALRNGGLVFSLEMQNFRLTDRCVATLGCIDGKKIQTGHLSESDFDQLTLAYNRMQEMPLAMLDTPGMKLHEIVSVTRKVKRDYEAQGKRLAYIIVDYIQLMGSDLVHLNRNGQIEEISRGFKSLAKELNIPVIILSQFNRSAAKVKRPSISDLRDCGAIEQDADIILFPYREEQDDPNTDWKGYADLFVAKQRNGPLAHIGLKFDGRYTKFSDWSGAMPDRSQDEEAGNKKEWKK